jgi:polyphosphate kinase
VPLEDVIAVHLDQLFPGMEVLQHHTFRVTRNEDLEVEEDDAENLLQALEKELLRRRFGPPVRLELAEDVDPHVRDLLVRELGVSTAEVYLLPEPWTCAGSTSSRTSTCRTCTTQVRAQDAPAPQRGRDRQAQRRLRGDPGQGHPPAPPVRLVHTSVQAFLEQAAADPAVLAIKQTLYRTSGDSPIVDALIDAAEAGKQVLALVEIKARFDEQANITWARKLEQAACTSCTGSWA